MRDKELLARIINNDASAIHDFFFIQCYDIFTYIGQYFCDGLTAEEIIGEAYEVLSSDDWHKLKIFKFSSSLVTYVSVIIARHFQHKRDMNTATNENILERLGGKTENDSSLVFLMSDIKVILRKFNTIDQILLTHILLNGEKPRDVIELITPLLKVEEGVTFVISHTKEQLSGYIYTRYSRAKLKFQNYMKAYGYGR